MFKSKERSQSHAGESISIIAGGMKIIGDIESQNDMRIDGTIEGNVFCKAKVVLGPSGNIHGDLHAENADVFGKINGSVVIKDFLCLKSKCVINGDLIIDRLEIEPEADFNGKCKMSHGQQASNAYVSSDNGLSYQSQY